MSLYELLGVQRNYGDPCPKCGNPCTWTEAARSGLAGTIEVYVCFTCGRQPALTSTSATRGT